MSALANYSEKLLLDWLMTNSTATRPSARYLAIYTAAPSDTGGGTEVSGSGYSRQVVTFADAASPGGTTNNSNAPAFTAAGGNFGTVTHIGIFDAATAGNLLWHGAMQSPRTVNDGDTLSFAVGAVNLTLA